MIAFEVFVNGKRTCIAGVGPSGVLHVIVNWVGRSPRSPRVGGRTNSGESWVNVGGMYVTKSRANVHPRWVDRVVKPGDEVVVRVVNARRVDPPKSKSITTAASTRRAKREYYLKMKEQFERKGTPRGRVKGSK